MNISVELDSAHEIICAGLRGEVSEDSAYEMSRVNFNFDKYVEGFDKSLVDRDKAAVALIREDIP